MSASMGASPTHHPRGLDPRRSAKYSVRISEDILKSGRRSDKYRSVKFNHKPPQSTAAVRNTTISNRDGNNSGLTIRDTDKDHKLALHSYKGQRSSSSKSYVLIFNEQKQTCTIEPLASTYSYNLTSTPLDSSSEKRSRQHPRIQFETPRSQQSESGESDDKLDPDEDGPGLDTDGSEADDDNPFDYRHFLHQQRGNPDSASSSPPQPAAYARSAVSTPVGESGRDTPTGTPASARKTAKSVKPLLKQPPRSKATPTTRKRRSPSPEPLPVPEVRIDRQASAVETKSTATKKVAKPQSKPAPEATRPVNLSFSSDDDDDGPVEDDDEAEEEIYQGLEIDTGADSGNAGLTIDFGDPDSFGGTKNRNFGLGVGDTEGGPISLRSAANSASPSSRLQSPGHDRRGRQHSNSDASENEFDEVADSPDGDVDSIALPSPVHENSGRGHVNKMSLDFEGDDDDEDDNDFEAELMQGLQSQDDDEPMADVGDTAIAPAVQSESESEEE